MVRQTRMAGAGMRRSSPQDAEPDGGGQRAALQTGDAFRTPEARNRPAGRRASPAVSGQPKPVPGPMKKLSTRAQNVLKQLDELDSKHGGSAASKEGRLFRAGVLFDLGRIDEAAQSYEKFLGESKGSPMTTVAREGLGLCKEQQGKLDEALAEYQKLEPKTGDFFRDRALWDEARVLTKKGDKKAAAEKLKELVAKVPTSPLKDEAQSQIAQLEGQ